MKHTLTICMAALLLQACTHDAQKAGTPVQQAIVDNSGGLVTLSPNQRKMLCNGVADCRDKGHHFDHRITLNGADYEEATPYPAQGREYDAEKGGYVLKKNSKR